LALWAAANLDHHPPREFKPYWHLEGTRA
jgi:hypothetical protein